MAYDALYKEIVGLSDDKLNLLIEFARFLKQGDLKKVCLKSTTEEPIHDNVRKVGVMADKFVYISPDFDDCLEGLEDYV